MKTAMTTRVGNARSVLSSPANYEPARIYPDVDKHLSIRAFLSRDKTLAVPSMLIIPNDDLNCSCFPRSCTGRQQLGAARTWTTTAQHARATRARLNLGSAAAAAAAITTRLPLLRMCPTDRPEPRPRAAFCDTTPYSPCLRTKHQPPRVSLSGSTSEVPAVEPVRLNASSSSSS